MKPIKKAKHRDGHCAWVFWQDGPIFFEIPSAPWALKCLPCLCFSFLSSIVMLSWDVWCYRSYCCSTLMFCVKNCCCCWVYYGRFKYETICFVKSILLPYFSVISSLDLMVGVCLLATTSLL